MKVEIRNATSSDILYISSNLRPADKAEMKAYAGGVLPPEIIPTLCDSLGDWTRVGTINDRPVCLYGVGPMPNDPTGLTGLPWMITTSDIERHVKPFLRRCAPEIEKMHETYPILANWVDTRNVLAVRWLRWLGFRMIDVHLVGPKALPFYHYIRTSNRKSS